MKRNEPTVPAVRGIDRFTNNAGNTYWRARVIVNGKPLSKVSNDLAIVAQWLYAQYKATDRLDRNENLVFLMRVFPGLKEDVDNGKYVLYRD